MDEATKARLIAPIVAAQEAEREKEEVRKREAREARVREQECYRTKPKGHFTQNIGAGFTECVVCGTRYAPDTNWYY